MVYFALVENPLRSDGSNYIQYFSTLDKLLNWIEPQDFDSPEYEVYDTEGNFYEFKYIRKSNFCFILKNKNDNKIAKMNLRKNLEKYQDIYERKLSIDENVQKLSEKDAIELDGYHSEGILKKIRSLIS